MVHAKDRQSTLGLSDLHEFTYQRGVGRVALSTGSVRLVLEKTDGQSYSDAQVDDYHGDAILRWRPPVQLYVRARFSHSSGTFGGTAGFGFWNDPFGMTKIGQRNRWFPRVRLPQATWFFFASPPSNMQLALDVAGLGWKAATIDASGVATKFLMPFAPLAMLACRSPWGYRRLWPLAQRVLKIDETELPVAMDAWHDYHLQWGQRSVCFVVDGKQVLCTKYSPRGPLGFVVWVDNQYMVATPQGHIRSGVIATDEQWMEIASCVVSAG